MNYKIAKQHYLQGRYEEVIKLAASRFSGFKRIPFHEGQPLRVEVGTDLVTGQYIGTLQDGLLLTVNGHPTLLPYDDIRMVCVYWV